MASNFYFGSSGEVEDGNDFGSSKSREREAPVSQQDDEEVITDDDIQDDPDIPVIENTKEKKEKPLKSKSKVEEVEEEEEESEEEEEETEEKEDKDKEEEEMSAIELVAIDLIQKGLLVPREGETYNDDDEGFAKLQEHTIEDKILENVPEEYSSLLAAIKQGIPAKDWVDLVVPNQDLKDADLDDEENQETIVARIGKMNGLNDEQITKRIARYKKLDTLRDEAEDGLAILIREDEEKVKKNNQDILENRKKLEKEQKEKIEKIYKDADSLEEVQGVSLNKKARKELADYVTKPINAKGQTQYMIDRNDPELMLEAAFLVKNAKNKTIQKVADSKATKSLKEKLDKRNDKMTSGRGRAARENVNSSKMPEGLPWSRTNDVED